MYMAIKGDVLVAERDSAGNAGALRDVGEVELCEITVDTEYLDNFTNNSPVSEQDLHVPVKRTAKGSLTLKEASAENLALALHGEVIDETSGAFSAAAFPIGIAAGETHLLPGHRTKVSSLVITDSAGSPATLVAGTDYVADLVNGTVKFLIVTGRTQPFKAAGSEATGKKSIAILKSQKVTNKFIRVQGVNIADEEKAVVVDIFCVSLMPAKKVGLGNKAELSMYEIEMTLLADPKKAIDAQMGRFGQYRLLEP